MDRSRDQRRKVVAGRRAADLVQRACYKSRSRAASSGCTGIASVRGRGTDLRRTRAVPHRNEPQASGPEGAEGHIESRSLSICAFLEMNIEAAPTHAVDLGELEKAREILAAGVDPDEGNGFGKTALGHGQRRRVRF